MEVKNEWTDERYRLRILNNILVHWLVEIETRFF